MINSDERSDERPVFEPVQVGDTWQASPNLSTIFVSGNVMSRGLTLEGLSTTLFTRSSDDPASDTQMQMQRWFGYRGKYIDVCRVLTSSTQLDLFKQYHETDLALRSQILGAMSEDEPAPPTVLQGPGFKATGKIRNAGAQPLWPGAEPFMKFLNSPEDDETNQRSSQRCSVMEHPVCRTHKHARGSFSIARCRSRRPPTSLTSSGIRRPRVRVRTPPPLVRGKPSNA